MTDIEQMGLAHRPWPPPSDPWIMAQSWEDLLFLHWPVSTHLLRAVVPPSLTLDIHDGQAWITITALRMTDVRFRMTPAIPGISTFPELNVRTYVTVAGAPGVYFLSLDADNPLAVEVARRWFHLPYHRADMTMRDFGDRIHFRSVRTEEGSPRAELITHYAPSGKSFHAKKDSVDYFLVERYCLYATDAEHNIYRADIHHRPWPLQEANAEVELNEMFLQFGLPLPKVPPLFHFAKRLEVVVWGPKLLFQGAP